MPFEADRLELEDLRHVVAGGVDVRVAEHEQRARLRARSSRSIVGLQNGDAGAFGADQRARDVEAVLGQQFVEVVARHAARDLREPRADQVGVAVAQLLSARRRSRRGVRRPR